MTNQLLDSTNYVVGIWSLQLAVFECTSMEEVDKLRNVYQVNPGILANSRLCVYTKEEWLKNQKLTQSNPTSESFTRLIVHEP